jgi:hypothetical protein
MGFTKFTQKGGGKGGGDSTVGPRVSLRKTATMGINNPATQEFFNTADHVELFNDAVNQKIGLHPIVEETSDAYKVKKSNKEGHGSSVNCRAFLREYDLVPDKTTRYKAEWDDERELVVIDLNNPDSVYGTN